MKENAFEGGRVFLTRVISSNGVEHQWEALKRKKRNMNKVSI